jgi:hypothetical protein
MQRITATLMAIALSACLPFGAQKTRQNKRDSIYTGAILTAVGGGLTVAADPEANECSGLCYVGVPIALIGITALILAAGWDVTD